MLAQLASVKSRLALADHDPTHDALLTAALQAISARFDLECNRSFARTENATHEFPADQTEIIPACYPIESVTKFELKEAESTGWLEQTNIDYLIRNHCIISLSQPLSYPPSSSLYPLPATRVTYTGAYVLPGTAPGSGQTPLPADIESAAIEQLAFWFTNRDRLGLSRIWDYHGSYRHFATLDLLPSVQSILAQYRRWAF